MSQLTLAALAITILFTFCNAHRPFPFKLLTVRDYEMKAKHVMISRNQSDIWWYLAPGAFDDETVEENQLAYKNIRIRPHFMRDVSVRDLSTTILGRKVAMPIGISPSAMQKHWDPQGELASVAAADEMGTIMILSLASTYSLEQVAQAAPNATKWFQMFMPHKEPEQRAASMELFQRAENAGYSAIVFTVDTSAPTLRYTMERNNFSFFGKHKLGNFERDFDYIDAHESRLTWKDLAWVKPMTKLPIIIKGILTAEDAREAVNAGVAGIVVSNHGGRELDGVPATIEALPEIVDAVKGSNVEVYMDGGVRSGKDVFKALALGARAVFVGRPVPFGLIVGGKDGAVKVLQILKTELDTVMGLAGCASLAQIQRDNVAQKIQYALRANN